HDRRAGVDHPAGVPAVEGRETLADARPAADALGHQGEPLDGAGDIALAQGVRDMNETRVEYEGLSLAEGIDHAVDEAKEKGRIEAHGAGGVEQNDEAQRLGLAPPPDQLQRRAAMGDAAMDGPAKVEAPAAATRALPADQPGAHAPGKSLGQLMGSGGSL